MLRKTEHHFILVAVQILFCYSASKKIKQETSNQSVEGPGCENAMECIFIFIFGSLPAVLFDLVYRNVEAITASGTGITNQKRKRKREADANSDTVSASAT